MIFMKKLKKINEHNARYERGEESFTMALNHLSDLTQEEYKKLNGYRKGERRKGSTFMRPFNVNIPDKIDWRENNYVTPIKDQGDCGSCWAFSATGALEGQHKRKTGKLVSLSEQNLVDCSHNDGCEGGYMDLAFGYVQENKGIDTEESYPYEGRDGKCRFKKKNVGATDRGFIDIESGNEEVLKEAVATIGPISVAIDASGDKFQMYEKGVYKSKHCGSTNESLNHGVLLVGYDTDQKEGDYWIVKNSWGTDWGNNGYIWIARNHSNMCGIATDASYPLL
ncbi:unnamed protein product [Dracunculus medinensis]|uniref:Cathepsin L-like n=1 Tax=Dracunculus medinensis TaxID=318479 RepID=A0A0N4UAM5_DRAME|nr:unnamed protein product [Dracunculus medinensis]